MIQLGDCPVCAAPVGFKHLYGCTLEQCPCCGAMEGLCSRMECPHNWDEERLVWTGRMPGSQECEEYGWFLYFNGLAMSPCTPDDPQALPDLARLREECKWVAYRQRFVRRTDIPPIDEAFTPAAGCVGYWMAGTDQCSATIRREASGQYRAEGYVNDGNKESRFIRYYTCVDPYIPMQDVFDFLAETLGLSATTLLDALMTFRDMQLFIPNSLMY